MKKVLLDLNHSGDVHFAKNLYFELISRGYEVLVVASRKPLTYELLEEIGIPYYKIGSYGNSNISKAINLVWLDLKMLIACLRFKPDIMLGTVAFRIAHIGWLLNIPAICFDDTQHATEQMALIKPFAKKVYTPINYIYDLGKNHRRYHGYHELCYLHPKRFSPDKGVLKLLQVQEGAIYTIIRFVAWNATHDVGMEKGFTDENKIYLVQEFLKYGKVFITSEKGLPAAIQDYAIKIPPSKIHHAIAFSAMVFGESSTMSSEAAVLGVPAVFVDDAGRCYTDEQEEKYGLVYNYKLNQQREAINKGIDILKNRQENTTYYQTRRQQLLEDKIDVTQLQLDIILNY